MNLQPLFTTARVVTAVYRIASTTLLLIYLAQRGYEKRKYSRSRRAGTPGAFVARPSYSTRDDFPGQ